jgi:DNA-binding transcriptional MerR regulator
MQSRELIKLYYRIGEVSEIVGVQPHVLRYWETEFRSIRPQKSSKGQRVYSRRDVEKLLRVKDLLRNQGFTIAGARKRLSDPSDLVPAPAAPASVAPPAGMASAGAAPAAVVPSGVAPVALSIASAPPALHVAPAAAEPASTRSAAHGVAERSAKDMRRALLGLRQDLMRMLGEIEASRARERGGH